MARKIITFSFDDGVTDDVRLIELFNRYGLKGTFNLNSGTLSNMCSRWKYVGGMRGEKCKDVTHYNFFKHQNLYDGHEIAVHTHTHPHMNSLSYDDQYAEIWLDKKFLSTLCDYEIVGMASPFGEQNAETVRAMQACGIRYCRTTRSTYKFDFPIEFPLFDPTCSFIDPRRTELAEEFLTNSRDTDMLFYIWGHSYELVTRQDWADFEEFCKLISHREGVEYLTNREAFGM